MDQSRFKGTALPSRRLAMAVIVDVAAIEHNARTIRSLCDPEGLVVRAMFKHAYALPRIIAASGAGGIASFAASSRRAALRVASLTGRCALCGPDVAALAEARQVGFDEVYCTSVETARRLASAPPGRFVWLGVRTSDGRDGVAPDALAEAVGRLSRISGAAGRIGIMATWGAWGAALPPPRSMRLPGC